MSTYDNFALKSGHGIHVKTLMGCVRETLLHIPACLQWLLQAPGRLALISEVSVECLLFNFVVEHHAFGKRLLGNVLVRVFWLNRFSSLQASAKLVMPFGNGVFSIVCV